MTPDDTAARLAALEHENAKLRKINRVLMDRVERSMDFQGNAFSLFQTAIVLEGRVRERTRELEAALGDLEDARLSAEEWRRVLGEAIGSIDEGFLLCDRHDQVVLSNDKYRSMWMCGIGTWDDEMSFETLIRRAAQSGAVRDAWDDPEAWVAWRLAHHHAPSGAIVIRMADGRWFQVSERRTRDGGTVGLHTDITEVKRSEERRRRQELAEKSVLLQSTLDNLTQGVSVFDAAQHLVAWNYRFVALTGAAPGLARIGTPLDAFHRLPAMAVQLARPGSDALTREVENPDGTVLEVRRNPMPGGGFVTTYADITERRLAARQLEDAKESLERRVAERTRDLLAAKAAADQANLSKTRFLAAASHDLLQPLSAARVFASVLTERRLAPANRALVRSTLAALDSVDELLTALLDISKLDAGVEPVQMCDFALAGMFATLADEYAMLAHARGLSLRLLPATAAVASDPRLLARILRNYLANAIRYTPPGGRILMGCRRLGARVMVGVWDTGPGIPADKQEEIFEEFHRLHPDDDGGDGARGMGLGLAIVKRVARVLGHDVVVRSRPGRGSLFGIVLDRGSGLPQPAPIQRPAAVTRLEGALLAIVENDRDILAGITALVDNWGCHTATGTSLADVRTSLAGRRPHMILADFHLDHGEIGLDAIAALRAEAGTAIPAILMTADHSDDLHARAQALDCHVLNKPLRPAKLRSLIAHLLETRGKD